MNEEQKVELKLIHMEEVVSKEVSWLWYPYIPYGKITVIEGDPGEVYHFPVMMIDLMNQFILFTRPQKMELTIRLSRDWNKMEQIVL